MLPESTSCWESNLRVTGVLSATPHPPTPTLHRPPQPCREFSQETRWLSSLTTFTLHINFEDNLSSDEQTVKRLVSANAAIQHIGVNVA